MPKLRDRICIKCGMVEFNTATHSDTCYKCYWQQRTALKIEAELKQVKDFYGNGTGPTAANHSKRCYTFVHTCGTKQTWTFGNLLKMWKKRPNKAPCSRCGGKERMSKAMDGYVAKFQLDERARTDLRSYTKKVRHLSEKVYRDNIDILNPERHVRMLGNQGHHLDHIVPIVVCFNSGWSPVRAASISNLQVLKAAINLQKGRRVA